MRAAQGHPGVLAACVEALVCGGDERDARAAVTVIGETLWLHRQWLRRQMK